MGKIIQGSGNDFRDVGFGKHESAKLLVRADLLIALQEAIRRRRLTRLAAAKRLGVDAGRIKNIMGARLDRVRDDGLVELLSRLDVQVHVKTSPMPRRTRATTTKRTTR